MIRRWLVPRRWFDQARADLAIVARRLEAAQDEAEGWKRRALRDDNLRAASPLALRSRCAHLEQENATLLAKLDEATAELARRPDPMRLGEVRHG